MRTFHCDCCKREIKPDGGRVYQLPCHIAEDGGRAAYVDREGNACSGRMVDFDLCNKCYNRICTLAFVAIKTADLQPSGIMIVKSQESQS